MEIIRGLHNVRPKHVGSVLSVGSFDGIHRGHQAVLKSQMQKAKALATCSLVMFFEPLPREYFTPQQAPARLMNFREKLLQLRLMGVDYVLRIPFNKNISGISAHRFIHDVFVNLLQVRHMVVGEDMRFGHARQGDHNMLVEAGKKHNFSVTSTATIDFNHQRISSTRLRKALADGDFNLAEQLLGRPYTMAGRVVHGYRKGRQLGFPTANILLQRHKSPLKGVFIVNVKVGEHSYDGVANIGVRPTLYNNAEPLLEVHLFNFDRELYGCFIEVTFYHHLRDEKRFDGLEQLCEQVAQDIAAAKAWLAAQ